MCLIFHLKFRVGRVACPTFSSPWLPQRVFYVPPPISHLHRTHPSRLVCHTHRRQTIAAYRAISSQPRSLLPLPLSVVSVQLVRRRDICHIPIGLAQLWRSAAQGHSGGYLPLQPHQHWVAELPRQLCKMVKGQEGIYSATYSGVSISVQAR